MTGVTPDVVAALLAMREEDGPPPSLKMPELIVPGTPGKAWALTVSHGGVMAVETDIDERGRFGVWRPLQIIPALLAAHIDHFISVHYHRLDNRSGLIDPPPVLTPLPTADTMNP